MAGAGHNSFAKDQLKAFVERVEHLEDEKKQIGGGIRDIYAEAKASGFDVKTLRTIVRLRKQDPAERREQEAILETYMHALGMLAGTPLGDAAIARDIGPRLADTANPPFNATDDEPRTVTQS